MAELNNPNHDTYYYKLQSPRQFYICKLQTDYDIQAHLLEEQIKPVAQTSSICSCKSHEKVERERESRVNISELRVILKILLKTDTGQ